MSDRDIDIKITADIKDANKKIASLTKEIDKLKKSSKSSTSSSKEQQQQFSAIGKSAGLLNKKLIALVATYASFEGAKKAIQVTADVEEGFLNVAKTTGLAGEEFEKLKDGINGMATSMAGVEFSGLQEIAEIAGQLGIQGTDDILEFTRVVTMMATTTEMSAQASADAMAVLSKSYGIPISEVERLASSINELSNTTNANATVLVDYATRLAPMATTMGLTAQEALALGASLKEVGIGAEVGGTALSRLLAKMLQETSSFADLTGTELLDFADLIEKKPIEAVEKFIESFAELDKYEQTAWLKDMKLNGSGVASVILKMASAQEVLAKNTRVSNTAFEENTSMSKEYGTSSKGLNAQLTKLSSIFIVITSKLGNALLPAFKKMIDATEEWYKTITDDDIDDFKDGILTVIDTFETLIDTIKVVNDLGMPDIIGGKDAGLIDTVADGWGRLAKKVNEFAEALRKTGATKDLGIAIEDTDKKVQSFIDSLGTTESEYLKALDGGKALREEYISLAEQLTNLRIENEALRETMSGAGKNTDLYSNALKKLGENEERILTVSEKLGKVHDDIFVQVGKDAKEGAKGVKELAKSEEDLASATKRYSSLTLGVFKKMNSGRLKDANKTIKSLEKQEKQLQKEILKIQNDLATELKTIAEDRFTTQKDLANEIRDLELSGLDEKTAYYQRLKDADKELSDAKRALIDGDLTKYKEYIERYKELVTAGGDTAIKSNDAVVVSADEVRKTTLDGLKTVSEMENKYFDEKKRQAEEKATLALEYKEIELESIKAQLEAQKGLIEAIAKANELMSGKAMDVDTSALDRAMNKIDGFIDKIHTIKENKAEVKVDSTEVVKGQKEIKKLTDLTINGTTLKVEANTTPADFGVDKLISDQDAKEITMTVNPAYETAQAEIDAFRNAETAKPVKLTSDVEIEGSKAKVDTLKNEASTPIVTPLKVEPRNLDTVNAELQELTKEINAKLKIESNVEEVQEKLTPLGKPLETDLSIKSNVDEVVAETKKLEKPTKSTHTVNDNVKTVASGIKKLTKNTGSNHKISDNSNQVLSRINKLKVTTHSQHIIHEKVIRSNSTGGLQPQGLADGGSFSGNGRVPGYDASDSDKVTAMLTGGEYVIKRASVDRIGIPALEYANTKGKLPAYASGGEVSKTGESGGGAVVNLHIGGKEFKTFTDREVADALQRFIEVEGGL